MFKFLRKRLKSDHSNELAGAQAVLFAYEKLAEGEKSDNLWVRVLHTQRGNVAAIDAYRLSLHESIMWLHRGPDNAERIVDWATAIIPRLLQAGEASYSGQGLVNGVRYTKAQMFRAQADLQIEIACYALQHFNINDAKDLIDRREAEKIAAVMSEGGQP